ncbi:MAG: helix-turn-helix transcriptional regulator [Candidatus Hermodarchaeota archaeon]
MSRKAIGRVLDRYEIDQRIVEIVAVKPNSTIDAIATETGLSYTAVRNSLQRLISLKVIVETYDTEGPSRRGRPATLFRIDKGLQIFIPPRQFQHLALTLIEQLIKEEGTEYVASLLDRAAQLQVAHVLSSWEEANVAPKTLENVIERICEYINQQGCYATHTVLDKGFYIQVNNCVYEGIATAYPGTICRFHESFIIHMIQHHDDSTKVSHEQSIAEGAHNCLYVILQP